MVRCSWSKGLRKAIELTITQALKILTEHNQTNDMSTNIKSAIFLLNLPLRRRSGSFFITPMIFTNFSLLYVLLTKTFFNVEFVQEKGLKLFFFYFHRNHAANGGRTAATGGRTAVKNYFAYRLCCKDLPYQFWAKSV